MVVTALRNKFDLTPEETHELVELAEAEADEAIDHYQFTSLIKTGFSQEQKQKVVEYLWAVAFADENVGQARGVPGPQDRQPHRRVTQGIHRGEAAGAGRRGGLVSPPVSECQGAVSGCPSLAAPFGCCSTACASCSSFLNLFSTSTKGAATNT